MRPTKSKFPRLGDLQLQIMKALWSCREATVTEVQEAIPKGTDLAYTTVATMLRKMEARGLVKHRSDGRAFFYRANVAEDQVTRGMAEHVLDRLFGGSIEALVSNLLTSREVSGEELARIEKLIAERRKSS
jgi:predicted transcriptional regulator